MSLIQIEELTRSYGRRRGIERVTLEVAEGTLFGFLGPNGAGKTTTIRVLLGFLRATGGSARIFGLDCWREGKQIKREVGYVPGDLRLSSWMNGMKALSIFGAIRGRDITQAGYDLAARFDLDMRVPVRAMSRGMRQKLGLILALAHNPRLLVMDEPTSGLDPLMQHQLHDLLRELAGKGHTVFFSSHSLSEVEELCDQVAIVKEGELVAKETLGVLRERAGHDVIIHWQDKSQGRALEPPPFLTLIRRGDLVWEGNLEGSPQRLIDFLAGKPLADLSIGRPDLETLFKRFYTSEGKQ